MAAAANEFNPWLIEKLNSLQIDVAVYSWYIRGILEGEDSVDEKRGCLDDILSDIVGADVSNIITELLEKWESCHSKQDTTKSVVDVVDEQLSKLMNTRCLTTTARREYTDEEKKIREAILSQYSQLSDNEDEAATVEQPDNSDLVKNTNAADVQAANRERREQARQDAQKKKERDKEDREKQKQMKEDKKEKRKTVKGERKM